METEYSYREDGELSGLVPLPEQGQVLLNFDYDYDGNGNCVRKSGETYQNEYAYDRMNLTITMRRISSLVFKAERTCSDTFMTDRETCWWNRERGTGHRCDKGGWRNRKTAPDKSL